MLTLKNIKIEYDGRILLKQDELTFNPGRVYVICGESGCGKTSLLYQLGLLSQYSFVDYYYNHQHITTHKDKEWLRKNIIGYVFQDKNLQDDLNVYQNLACFRMISGKKMTEEKAKELLETVGLAIPLTRQVTTLSGGEKQRLAIACALAKNSQIIIADEPTSSLDEKNKENIVRILERLATEFNKLIIVASHDQCFLKSKNRLYLIHEQKIQSDKSEEIQTTSLNKTPIYSKFYTQMLKYKQRSYFKSMKKILWVSFIIIGLSGLALTLNKSIIQSYKDKIELLLPNEIIATNLYDNNDLEFIKSMESVKQIRPYYEISQVDFNDNQLKDSVIHTYYDEDLLSQNKIKDDKTGQVYLSYALKDYKGDMVRFNYQKQTYEYSVSGIFDNNIRDIYQTEKTIIYLPKEFFEDKNLQTGCYIIEVKDIEDIDSTMSKILNINSSLQLVSEYKDTDKLLQVQENLSIFVKLGVSILTIIALLSVSMSQILEVNSRIYEISIFKANGLQNKSLFKLEMMRICYLLVIGNILIDIFGSFILLICQGLLKQNIVFLSYYLLVFIISSLSMIIPMMISLYKVSHLSIEKVLR